MEHPSRNIEVRRNGFGIAAGFEISYDNYSDYNLLIESRSDQYVSIPHCGYYGVGLGSRPFKIGEAGFSEELAWYKEQHSGTTASKEK